MFFRRSQANDVRVSFDVAPAHQALAEGRVEAALTLLEGATRRQRRRTPQAEIRLYLAATYALYGAAGVEWGSEKLREAAELDSEVSQSPLYRALYWEFAAYRGESAQDVCKGALAVARTGDAFAVYHAASALFAIHSYRRATRLLKRIDPLDLPNYLHWRYWSLLGKCLDASDELTGAVTAFERAISLSVGDERRYEHLNLASSLLELNRPKRALRVLQGVSEYDFGGSERLIYLYLRGRAQLLLGNPTLALEFLERANTSEESLGDVAYAQKLALAQCYGTLGNYAQAAHCYAQAVALAPSTQRSWTQHECAILLSEAEKLPEARDLLLEVLRSDSYAYRAEVYADLAELEYKLANLGRATEYAHRALDLGAVASACLTLGSVAYEYYHLDDAVAWFEKAASSSREGETDWLHAQQMLADIFVQQGLAEPERVIRHAEAALKHLHPNDEWSLILQAYASQARTLLGGHSRRFN